MEIDGVNLYFHEAGRTPLDNRFTWHSSARGYADAFGKFADGESLDVSISTVDPPTIEQMSVVSDAGPDETYGFGDTVEVAARFSEPVDVTAGDGRLQASLYLSGSWREPDWPAASLGTPR